MIGRALVNHVIRTGRPTNLLCLGPLTDIARALRFCPDLATYIGRAVVMGGALGKPLENFALGRVQLLHGSCLSGQSRFVEPGSGDSPTHVTHSILFTHRDTRSLPPFASRIIGGVSLTIVKLSV